MNDGTNIQNRIINIFEGKSSHNRCSFLQNPEDGTLANHP